MAIKWPEIQYRENPDGMPDQLVKRMSQSEPMPDKNRNPLVWIQRMNALKAQAEEVVIREIVFT